MVRRAEKGLTVRKFRSTTSSFEGIHAIYNESPVRQGRPFWHYGKDVEIVRRENATFLERSVFIGVFLDSDADRVRQARERRRGPASGARCRSFR